MARVNRTNCDRVAGPGEADWRFPSPRESFFQSTNAWTGTGFSACLPFFPAAIDVAMETGHPAQQERPGSAGRGFAHMAPVVGRPLRLMHILREFRSFPAQSLETVLKTFGISRSQSYKDKDAHASLGFYFEYRKGSGFRITENRLTLSQALSLSVRVILLFALEYLGTSADGLLAAKAIEVGHKQAYGLDSPMREGCSAALTMKSRKLPMACSRKSSRGSPPPSTRAGASGCAISTAGPGRKAGARCPGDISACGSARSISMRARWTNSRRRGLPRRRGG